MTDSASQFQRSINSSHSTRRQPTEGRSRQITMLIPDLKAGSSPAYSRLHSILANRLLRSAYRLLGDRQEAEDVVQQAFLELVRAHCPPDDGPSLEAWLYRSVHFTCVDQFRRRARRPYTPMAELPPRGQEDTYWIGYDAELEAAMAELTPRQRLVMHLKHVEGFDGNEIANITNSSRVAVYAIATRAERSLRRHLRDHET